jgi:hypothetical protein
MISYYNLQDKPPVPIPLVPLPLHLPITCYSSARLPSYPISQYPNLLIYFRHHTQTLHIYLHFQLCHSTKNHSTSPSIPLHRDPWTHTYSTLTYRIKFRSRQASFATKALATGTQRTASASTTPSSSSQTRLRPEQVPRPRTPAQVECHLSETEYSCAVYGREEPIGNSSFLRHDRAFSNYAEKREY